MFQRLQKSSRSRRTTTRAAAVAAAASIRRRRRRVTSPTKRRTRSVRPRRSQGLIIRFRFLLPLRRGTRRLSKSSIALEIRTAGSRILITAAGLAVDRAQASERDREADADLEPAAVQDRDTAAALVTA